MISKDSQKKVTFSDFAAAHDGIRLDVEVAIARVVNSGQYILGKELVAFEEELADYLGGGFVVGVGNGTDALALSLMALEVKSGDEIITTDFTPPPTIAAIHQVGAVPKLIDIDPNTGLIDTSQIEKALTSRTRGIVPVHLYGRSCDMTTIEKIACDNKLWIVEDCAQAIGAKHSGRTVGSFGAIGALSFYPTKNLGAYGDAGAVFCHDIGLAKKLRTLRNYGLERPNEHVGHGINSRLDEIQAAILRVKLRYLQEWSERRAALANKYYEELPCSILPAKPDKDEHVHHLFPILVQNRDLFRDLMQAAGIETMVHYPTPVHRQPAIGHVPDELFPTTIRWSSEVLSLPLHPHLTDDDVNQVVKAVHSTMEKLK